MNVFKYLTGFYQIFLGSIIIMTIGCTSNLQKSPLLSPNQNLSFSMVKKPGKGGDSNKTFWFSRMETAEGQFLYQDGVGIEGNDEIYWQWDKKLEVVWIYNQTKDTFFMVKRDKNAKYQDPNLGYIFLQSVWYEALCQSDHLCPPPELKKLKDN